MPFLVVYLPCYTFALPLPFGQEPLVPRPSKRVLSFVEGYERAA